MPLVILGLIVVLGVCLLLYYQLGPKNTLRLKGSGLFGSGAAPDADDAAGETAEAGAGDAAEAKDSGDEKVLYVFGDGGREERSLREDGEQSKEE